MTILKPDADGKVNYSKSESLFCKFHYMLIELLVGKRPVVMNVAIGPHEMSENDRNIRIWVDGGLFKNVVFHTTETHAVTIGNHRGEA